MENLINKLHVSECAQFMKENMNEGSVDLVVTSPPYGSMRNYNGYDFNFSHIAKQLYRVICHNGVLVWVVADQTINGDETSESFKQALYFKDIGFCLFDTMIYQSSSTVIKGNSRGYWDGFEYMFVFCKGRAPKTINLIKDVINKKYRKTIDGGRRDSNDKTTKLKYKKVVSQYGRRSNVWKYSAANMCSTKDKIAFIHPAIFPEKLAHDHIVSWSNPNDLVFDPMCGSGTTCKMAKLLGRDYIGVDISEEYIEIAENRLKQDVLI